MAKADISAIRRFIGPALSALYGANHGYVFQNDDGGMWLKKDGEERRKVPDEVLQKIIELQARPAPTRIDPLQEEIIDVLAEENIIPAARVAAIKRKLNRVR